MIETISVVISAITLIILLINQYKMMKDKEPQLLFSLRSIDNILFLKVKNSGLTKAKNIKITIDKIYNNGGNGLQEDQIFQIPFELSSQEEVQGMIAILGESLSNHVFPYIDIKVKYDKPHFIKKVKYDRQVFYYSSAENRISVDTGLNFRNIDHNVNNIHKSVLRLANYFDGNEVAPFDELDLLSSNHFTKDIKNIRDGKDVKINTRDDILKEMKDDF